MPKSPADPVLPRSSRPWFLTLLVMGILAVAIVALYVDDASAAVAVWRGSAAHQFSFLVLPISLYFIWLRREDLGRMMPQPSPLLALTAVPFGALWLAADAAQVAFAAQVAVVAFVQVAIVTMVGVQVCRAALFPLLFLWFMVPFGESLLPSLMSMTTTFTVGILNFFGLESVAEGNLFTSGSGEYVIIEDCASLDFLLGNLIISLVFANLMYRGLVRRVIYALAAIPIAIVANLVRTTSVVMITEISGGKVDLALDHGLFGWFIFCIAVMVQMRIGLVYRDSGDDAGRAVGIEAIVVNTNCDPPRSATCAALALALVIGAPPVYAMATNRPLPVAPETSLCAPPWLDDRLPEGASPAWQPVYTGAHSQLSGTTRSEGAPVDFFVAFYLAQTPKSEMISWSNRVYGSKQWHFVQSETRAVGSGNFPFTVVETRIRDNDDGRRLVWHWYWVDGRFVADAILVKFLQAKTKLFFGDRRSAVVAFSVEESADKTSAEQALQKMLSHAPTIGQMLAVDQSVSCDQLLRRASATSGTFDRI